MSSTSRGGQRHPADFYETPEWCVHSLLDAWCPTWGGNWIEPAAGNGAIIKAVENWMDTPLRSASSREWTAVELRTEAEPELSKLPISQLHIGDFVSWVSPHKYDVLITNPPFSLAQDYILRGLQTAKHVALLLQLNFLGSADRAANLWPHIPQPYLYILTPHPKFTERGNDSCEYAWFVWSEATKDGNYRILEKKSAT